MSGSMNSKPSYFWIYLSARDVRRKEERSDLHIIFPNHISEIVYISRKWVGYKVSAYPDVPGPTCHHRGTVCRVVAHWQDHTDETGQKSIRKYFVGRRVRVYHLAFRRESLLRRISAG